MSATTACIDPTARSASPYGRRASARRAPSVASAHTQQCQVTRPIAAACWVLVAAAAGSPSLSITVPRGATTSSSCGRPRDCTVAMGQKISYSVCHCLCVCAFSLPTTVAFARHLKAPSTTYKSYAYSSNNRSTLLIERLMAPSPPSCGSAMSTARKSSASAFQAAPRSPSEMMVPTPAARIS